MMARLPHDCGPTLTGPLGYFETDPGMKVFSIFSECFLNAAAFLICCTISGNGCLLGQALS